MRRLKATRSDNLAEATSPRPGLGRAAEPDPTEPPLLALSKALGTDFGLIATFGGIGLLVNGIVVYIYFQVKGEHQQNQDERTPPG